jgi:hypothetical protein
LGLLEVCLEKSAERQANTKSPCSDGRGKLQSSVDSGEWPDGAIGYHTIEVSVG